MSDPNQLLMSGRAQKATKRRSMTTYLIETYWTGVNEPRFADVVARLAGTPTHSAWRGSLREFDPRLEDEIVLCLATGPLGRAVRATALRPGLAAERVVPCVAIQQEPVVPQLKES